MSLRGEVVAIGDELLHGALLDTNSKWLAGALERVGVVAQRFTVTGDDPALCKEALAGACERADVVVVTGGLGPTLDDRTRDVVAELLGGPLWFDEASWQQIHDWLHRRGRPVPESNRRQAMLPPGARALDNQVGTAPGFAVRVGRATLFAVPGVPREMQDMVQRHVLPATAALPGLTPTAHWWLRVLGPSEAALGERIEAWMVPGRNPAVGITASGGLLTVRVVGTAATAAEAEAACAATAAELRGLLGDWLFAEGNADLPELLVQQLTARGATVALAESCTGGQIAAQLVDVPGASAVLRGGVVAYSNACKTELLGVPTALLDQHGAVSEPVVEHMAAAIRERLDATFGVATSGIAGPEGGTADKPVGTVCFALATAAGVRSWTLRIPPLGRKFVRDRAVYEVWRALLAAQRAPTD
ncbi:MAG: competence/damage-inducible protein A [Planctomycetes bacterium]|nr:competence/damage-inducible protein A [Planctomycetota bacterium]MCB9887515.1 competence/damage-inducible protein A [Planctomycetota bacterium]